jgi:hypothetical protein
MKGKWIFDSFAEWRGYLRRACWGLAKGLMRLVYAIVIGLVSLIVFCGKQVEAFCRRETVASLIIGFVLVLLVSGWVFTFVNGRMETRTAEHQRDSIGYKLDKMMQAYDGSAMVIVDNDTISYGE